MPIILIPVAPSNVSDPPLVVKLEADAESIEIPAVPLISIDPVVVKSISDALPIILIPVAPSNVNIPAVFFILN